MNFYNKLNPKIEKQVQGVAQQTPHQKYLSALNALTVHSIRIIPKFCLYTFEDFVPYKTPEIRQDFLDTTTVIPHTLVRLGLLVDRFDYI